MRIACLFALAGLSGYALAQTIPSAVEPASVAPAPIAATTGSAYVGAERCTSCYRAESLEYAKTPHAHLAAESRESITGCEMCHGPGKAHADGEEAARGDDAKTAAASKLIFSFRAGAKPNSERCLICHRSSREQQDFSHSTHLLHGVGCNECHATHLADVARAPNAVPSGLSQANFFNVPKRPEEARWLGQMKEPK